jgi:antitoxin (DNA-binding transcriptional repressor) of toxin-antitoxin stability system
MKRVGLRALQSRLGEYVRRVRGGQIVLIVERGEVIAEMLPPGSLDALAVPSEGSLPELARWRRAAPEGPPAAGAAAVRASGRALARRPRGGAPRAAPGRAARRQAGSGS